MVAASSSSDNPVLFVALGLRRCGRIATGIHLALVVTELQLPSTPRPPISTPQLFQAKATESMEPALVESNPARTARRIRKLEEYVRCDLLYNERFICKHHQDCRASAPPYFYEGQMSHVRKMRPAHPGPVARSVADPFG